MEEIIERRTPVSRTYRVAPGVYRTEVFAAPLEEEPGTLALRSTTQDEVGATQDAWTNQFFPDENNGASSRILIAREYFKDGSGRAYGYIQFDLSGVPTPRFVVAATLHLYCSAHDRAGSERRLSIQRVAAAWNENTITWRNQPGVTGTEVALPPPPAAETWHNFEITEIVKAWVSDQAANNGIRLRYDAALPINSVIQLFYHSREGTNVPRLTIEYVDAPDQPTALEPGGAVNDPAYVNLTPTLTWAHAGLAEQGRFQVEIYDSTNALIHDSGQVASGLASYQVPAGILEWGQTYSWRVRTWDIGNAESPWSNPAYIETLGAPLAPQDLAPRDSQGVDANQVIRLSWTHVSPQGLPQAAYEVEVYDEEQNLIISTGQVASQNQHHDLAAATLNNGESYMWRVRTWVATPDIPGQWSPLVMFRGSRPPAVTITAPNAGAYDKGIVSVSWTFSDPDGDPQAWYRARLLRGGIIVEDSGQIHSPATQHAFATVLENEAEYTIEVTAANPWRQDDSDSVAIETEFTPPVAPSLGLVEDPEHGRIALAWVNPDDDPNKPATDRVDLWRREQGGDWMRLAAGLPPNSVYDDYTVRSGVVYEYRVTGISVDETPADSNMESGAIALQGVWLHAVDDPEGTIHRFAHDGRERGDEWRPTVAFYQFAGRPARAAQFGTAQTQDVRATLQLLKGSGDLEALQALLRRRKIVCYRDGRGRRVFGVLTALPVTDEVYGELAQITVHDVDYREGV